MNSCINCGKLAGYPIENYLIPAMTDNGIHWICVACVNRAANQDGGY